MPARLVKVRSSELDIIRERRGKGFCYRDAQGQLVCDAEFKMRVKQLGIPPAWTEVRLASHPRAHLQVLGKDQAGRMQYLYHPDWEQRRTARKQQRLAYLTAALPRLRRRVNKLLSAETGSLELALAIAVSLIDRTAMRVGREKYLEENGTRGAGTLFSRDVRVQGNDVFLKFPAKSGKTAEYQISDAKLVDAIKRIKTLAGTRLLVYRNAKGKIRPIKTEMINAFLREVSGAEISAKDFRTLHASALAAEALAEMEVGSSDSARKRQIASVVRSVSQFLRNTPMICRKSYIAPSLFQLFDQGKLHELWVSGETYHPPGLRPREQRLVAVLQAVEGHGTPKRRARKPVTASNDEAAVAEAVEAAEAVAEAA